MPLPNSSPSEMSAVKQYLVFEQLLETQKFERGNTGTENLVMY
jgi:hypothetical protein